MEASHLKPNRRTQSTPVACIALLTVVIWTFYPSVHNSYVNYDDLGYLIENNQVQQGLNWASLQWALTATAAANWHPLTWISHMVDCQIFGPKLWGHHLTSVLLHGINATLVFLLFRVATGSFWRSLVVAACFGLHPLRVESVTWLSERKDVLSACFAFTALMTYTSYGKQQVALKVAGEKSAWYWIWNFLNSRRGHLYMLALFLFALSLLSKPMMVTLPCVMLLMDFWPLKRTPQVSCPQLCLEKVPFFALSAILSVVTFMVQSSGGSMIPMAETTMTFRIENALISYARYLGKFFWPENLAPIYPVPSGWSIWLVAGAALLLLLVSSIVFKLRAKAPYALVGWLWFLGTLVPVIGLVAIGEQAMADRYTYFPLIGITVALTWGIERLTQAWPNRQALLAAVALGLLAASTFVTRRQIKAWENSETLFRHTIAATKSNYSAHMSLANTLSDQGRFEEALKHNMEAAQLRPDLAEPLNNVGVTLGKMGQIDAAITAFHQALLVNPRYPEGYRNLAFTLIQRGRVEEAIVEYQKSLDIYPDQPGIHFMLGTIYANEGANEKAIGHFETAIRLKPDYGQAHDQLAKILAHEGHQSEAEYHFREAARLNVVKP